MLAFEYITYNFQFRHSIIHPFRLLMPNRPTESTVICVQQIIFKLIKYVIIIIRISYWIIYSLCLLPSCLSNRGKKIFQSHVMTAAGSTYSVPFQYFHKCSVCPVSEWKIIIRDDVETKAQWLFWWCGRRCIHTPLSASCIPHL